MVRFKIYLTELSQSAVNKAIQRFVTLGIEQPKAKETVEQFNELQKRNQMTGVDIFKISWEDLTNKISSISKTKTQIEKEKKEDKKVVYKNNKAVVVVPLTHDASCLYGSGTKWCTTNKDSDAYFKKYTKDGTLFYILPSQGKKIAVLQPNSKHQEISIFNETDKEMDESWLKRLLKKYDIPEKLFRLSKHDDNKKHMDIDEKYIYLINLNFSDIEYIVMDDSIHGAYIRDEGIELYPKNNLKSAFEYYEIDKENQKILVKILDKENPNWHKEHKDVIDAVLEETTDDLNKIIEAVFNSHSEYAGAGEIIDSVEQNARENYFSIKYNKEKHTFNIQIDKDELELDDDDDIDDVLKKMSDKGMVLSHYYGDSYMDDYELKERENYLNETLKKALEKYWNSLVTDKDTPNLFKKVYKRKINNRKV